MAKGSIICQRICGNMTSIPLVFVFEVDIVYSKIKNKCLIRLFILDHWINHGSSMDREKLCKQSRQQVAFEILSLQ